MSVVVSIRDPFNMVYDLIESLEEAMGHIPVEEDEYRPLRESDEALLRAAALLQHALEILHGVSDVECPRFRAWDEAQVQPARTDAED